jgi:hypothetical protein
MDLFEEINFNQEFKNLQDNHFDISMKDYNFFSSTKDNSNIYLTEDLSNDHILISYDDMDICNENSVLDLIKIISNGKDTKKIDQKQLNLKDFPRSFDKYKYIDMLVKFFMKHHQNVVEKINKAKCDNEKFRPSIKDSNLVNKKESINNSFESKFFTLISSKISLNETMKLVVDFCNPNYYSFIITFILMSDLIETAEGLNCILDLKKIFLSCFFVSALFFEHDRSNFYKKLFENIEIQNNIVNSVCFKIILEILNSKKAGDFEEHKIYFENQYMREERCTFHQSINNFESDYDSEYDPKN